MGPYLSKPKTDIDSKTEQNDYFTYCTAEMQGWRKTQEDAHAVILNYDKDGTAFFGVFDGHGGDEVSKYCSLYLPEFIKNSSLYKEGKISEALEECFLKFDETLKQPDVLDKLNKLGPGVDEEINDNEYVTLRKEASMPIEDLLGKYYLENIANKKQNKEDVQNGKKDDEDKKEEQEEEKEKEDQQQPTSTSKEYRKKLFSLLSEETENMLGNFLEEDDEDESESDEDNEPSASSYDDDDDDDDDEEDDEDEESNEADNEDDDDDDDDNGDVLNDKAAAWDAEFNPEPGKGSGCTAIVAIIKDNKIYVANVGDSRCVLASDDGKAIDLSEDHKPEDEREKCRILKAGGEITIDGRVNGGLNLSRAIGDHIYKNNTSVSQREQMIIALPDIQIHPIDFDKDQFLVLACDGIWNSLNSQEVCTFVNERMKNKMELRQICEELFKECLAPNTQGDGSGCDNMTCILVQLKKPQSPPTNKRAREDEETKEEEGEKRNGEESSNSKEHSNDQNMESTASSSNACSSSSLSPSSSTQTSSNPNKKCKTEEETTEAEAADESDLYKPGPSSS